MIVLGVHELGCFCCRLLLVAAGVAGAGEWSPSPSSRGVRGLSRLPGAVAALVLPGLGQVALAGVTAHLVF